jgi:hypothetical protein
MVSKLYLIALAICLVIGGFVGWSLKPDKDCPDVKPNTLIEYRYIDKVDTVFIPKFYVRKDTITISQLDTFYIETKYIAAADTTFEDSSLTASIKFVSDIPLSNKSFFDMRFKVREKIITNTVIQTEEVGFWYKRFIPYLGIGISYNGKTVEPALQLGFGIRIN